MKTLSFAMMLLFSLKTFALNDYLKPEDQPYYQNDANGKNDLDRIDSSVREINKVWGEVIAMKAEIKQLKEQVAAMQAKMDAAAALPKKP